MKNVKIFEDFVNENYSINEAAGELTYLFYNMSQTGEDSWGIVRDFAPIKPSFFSKVAKYLGVGRNYTVGISMIEDTKGREWKSQVMIVKDVDTGEDVNYIGNTRYAPDGLWQGKGAPTEKADGWDFVDGSGKPLMIVNGVEVFIAKVGKVG